MSRFTKRMRKDSHRSTLSSSNELCHFSGGVNECMEGARPRRPQELTSEQLGRAQALANIKLNYQRPDEDLIKKMRKKNAAPVGRASMNSAPPTFPTTSTLSSSQIDQFARNMPVLQIGPLNVSPTVSRPSLSAQTLIDRQNWEELAKKGIAHKALSLDRVWDRKTWKQKANNIERLKLLKDDGYDITSLKVKGTSADMIITALLDHIKARKEINVGLVSTATASAPPPITGEEGSKSASEDSYDHHVVPVEADGGSRISDERAGSAATTLRKAPVASCAKTKRQPHVTSPLAGVKRKHTHEDEFQPEWHELNTQKLLHDSYNRAKTKAPVNQPCTCCMYNKVLRVMTPKEISKSFGEQAFDLAKRRVGRDIFRYSRAARRERHIQALTASSRYVAPSKPSRIILQPPASRAHPPSKPDAYMSVDGMNLITEELKHMAYCRDESGYLYITDPEEAEDGEGDRLMEVGHTGEEKFRYHIRVFATPALPMVIEGETMALLGLVKRLRKSELTHCHWQYDADRMEMVAENSVPWRLGDATQSALKSLERVLEAGQTLDGVEVRVEYLDSLEASLG